MDEQDDTVNDDYEDPTRSVPTCVRDLTVIREQMVGLASDFGCWADEFEERGDMSRSAVHNVAGELMHRFMAASETALAALHALNAPNGSQVLELLLGKQYVEMYRSRYTEDLDDDDERPMDG